MDGLAVVLVLLTTLLTFCVLVVACGQHLTRCKGYMAAFLVLETGMLGSLVALDTILFYVFWEVMLVPMYFIIGIWGGKRRIYAAMKFFLFTMAGSLLMFVGDPLRRGRPPPGRPASRASPSSTGRARSRPGRGAFRPAPRRSSSGRSPSPSS